jgi:hypothetical protein
MVSSSKTYPAARRLPSNRQTGRNFARMAGCRPARIANIGQRQLIALQMRCILDVIDETNAHLLDTELRNLSGESAIVYGHETKKRPRVINPRLLLP